MGKVSPVSIKYLIYANFNATGTVEKPDVIGALFGQTEGLLGQDLELRELQKSGKIGRIDVNLEVADGRTTGKIEIPSALDKTETTLIAAALETIERIGPSDAKIEIEKVEDVRGNKREYIIERAKKLLEQINSTSPETQEIHDAVTVSSRISKLQDYGTEKLPAGDLTSEEIIVVEGRADVLNLLKHGVSNVIGMNGTKLPTAIQELGNEKKIILFVDGDRGGILITKNVIKNADIDFIVFAADGKEVEELSGKEIISSLRKKMTVDEFREQFDRQKKAETSKSGAYTRNTKNREERSFSEGYKRRYEPSYGTESTSDESVEMNDNEKKMFQSILGELIGTRGACLIDSNLNIIQKVPSGEIIPALNAIRGKVYALVIDGIATLSIIRTAERVGCKHLVARNFASCQTRINLVSL